MEGTHLPDLLGDRWALCILIALAEGPMHFTDLRAALPHGTGAGIRAGLGGGGTVPGAQADRRWTSARLTGSPY